MGGVSQYDDDADRPEKQTEDTQQQGGTAPSYPPPLPGHPEPQQPQQQPGPYTQPYGQQVQPGPPQPGYGYGHTAPYPQQPRPAAPAGDGGSRFPGWVWPVVAVVALLVGLLGGVIGGVAVSTSMSSGGVSEVPVIGADNGAAAPLDADNGSVSAVAAKLLPSTVQIQARGGAGGTTEGGATGSGFVLDDKDHVITNNHVVADVAPLSTDNGAAAPLTADNGSIAAVAARLLPSTVPVQANGGAGRAAKGETGSGFVLDTKGHVITNNHVVADATAAGQLKVVDRDNKEHAARIIGRSPVYDIAVLDVSGASALRPSPIGSSRQLRVGDTVVAIGSPLGLSSSVTSGIVSATDRPVTIGGADESSYINALQTDAAINPGNSGGPLVNLRGQVVGVNSAIATTGASITGQSGNIGVGFAIPMEQVRVTAAQILATGKARYPVIGAGVDTHAGTDGAKVVDVPSGSPAAAAGLREGDVVTGVAGKPITDGISLIVAIRSHRPGETIDLEIRRNGQHKDVRVTLDSKVG